MCTIGDCNVDLKRGVRIFYKIINIFMNLKNWVSNILEKNEILDAHLENHRCFSHPCILNLRG